MTNEAEMLADEQLAIATMFDQGGFDVPSGRVQETKSFDLTRHQRSLISAALRAAARPASGAGLVEREAIARIIEPQAFSGLDETPADAFHNRKQPSAYRRADAILALLSTRAVAGEPVAASDNTLLRTRVDRYLKACVPEGTGARMIVIDLLAALDEALAATPAPSGRDPATIEAACEAIQNLRTIAACTFDDPKCRGQRGVDRTDTFYDAIVAVRALAGEQSHGS